MTIYPSFSTSRQRAAIAFGVLALVLAAQSVQAQSVQAPPTGATGASAGQPQNAVGAVVVHPRRRNHIPPDKAKAFAAEAARDEAWRNYRDSVPAPTAGPLEQSKDYPGLKDYAGK